jgi:putative oxidoreductase
MSAGLIAGIAVRYLLVVLFFPFSALDKAFNFDGAVRQAQAVFPPRAVAVALILVGLAIEIVMPLAILTGAADRLAALIMAAYCVATAVLFKPFWSRGDFWQRGSSAGRDLFWDFLKNFSLAGGFLLITVGLGGSALPQFLADPLASSHPYAWSATHPQGTEAAHAPR